MNDINTDARKSGKSAWRPDDKAWLVARKQEWRQVMKILDLIHDQNRSLPKRLRKHHKELFFYGTFYPEKLDGSASPFGFCQLFFLMWYYPEPSEEIFRAFCGAPFARYQLEKARNMLLDYSYLGSGPYGFLGGREELFVKVLIPPLDCCEQLVFPPSGAVLKDLSPWKVFGKCVGHSCDLLSSSPPERRPHPYIVGQYLWDQMDYAFEHYYEKLSYMDQFNRNSFLFADLDREMPSEIFYLFDLLRLILDFDERKDAPRDNPVAVALRERLLCRFESRGFSSRLMAVWDEAKAHYESGSKEPLWGLF
ncbi:MAG: hypothetical protein P8045_16050 [Candidatus Thiodiazotropha sp.]